MFEKYQIISLFFAFSEGKTEKVKKNILRFHDYMQCHAS